MTGDLVLAQVDRSAFAVAFTNRLRTAGVPAGQADATIFGRALAQASRAMLADRRSLYWIARISLVRRQTDLAKFDAVFAAVFDDTVFSLDPVAMRTPQDRRDDRWHPLDAKHAVDGDDAGGLPWATLPRAAAADDTVDADATPVWIPRPSTIEALAGRPFGDLDPAHLRQVEDWVDSALRAWPQRRGRAERAVADGRRIDVRRTLIRARRTGWEVADIAYRGPVWRDRRVVMICDVSQSVQAYTTVYLHLMRALSRRRQTETFAFATSLTRLTPMLARSRVDDAVHAASEKVTDRFGGTRIAASLDALLHSRQAPMLRGAICVIASDGWDSDDPAELGRVMARIARRAFTVIWLNPRAGAPGYRPLAGGMAAAAPYCDRLLPAATVDDVAGIVDAITGARRR